MGLGEFQNFSGTYIHTYIYSMTISHIYTVLLSIHREMFEISKRIHLVTLELIQNILFLPHHHHHHTLLKYTTLLINITYYIKYIYVYVYKRKLTFKGR